MKHSEPAERAVIEELPPYPRTQESVRAGRPARWVTVALLSVAIVVVYGALFVMVQRAQARHPAVALTPVATPAPTATYSNGFHFADSVPIADRQWIVQAVVHARPEAVRLIELIDQRTTVAPLRDGSALGKTWQLPRGRYRITLDLNYLDRAWWSDRALVVMHELGHVVNYVLVPNSLRDRLAAEVPASGFCPQVRLGDCAPPGEKFADTFAKWAYRGELSFRNGVGYYLPVPPSLDAWGAPLNRLARTPHYAPRRPPWGVTRLSERWRHVPLIALSGAP